MRNLEKMILACMPYGQDRLNDPKNVAKGSCEVISNSQTNDMKEIIKNFKALDNVLKEVYQEITEVKSVIVFGECEERMKYEFGDLFNQVCIFGYNMHNYFESLK